MNVFINNEQREISQPLSVQSLLEVLAIPHTRGIAVAINQEVVPKSRWQDHLVSPDDKVTIIKATQGG